MWSGDMAALLAALSAALLAALLAALSAALLAALLAALSAALLAALSWTSSQMYLHLRQVKDTRHLPMAVSCLVDELIFLWSHEGHSLSIMTPAAGTLAGTELEDASRSSTAGDTGIVAADFPCPSSPRSPVPAAGLSFSLLRLEIKI